MAHFKLMKLICCVILSFIMLFTMDGLAQVTGPEMNGSVGMPTWVAELPLAPIGESKIADWKHGKQTAMAVSYDDSSEGAALYGVPQMFQKGLVGTWFVNPGNQTFQDQQTTWHDAYTIYGQEVANHTFYHEGGESLEIANQSIDLATDYIKEHIYKMIPDQSGVFEPKILAFNRGGGSTWPIVLDSPEWNSFIRNKILFERKHSSGSPIDPSFDYLKQVILSLYQTGDCQTTGGSVHFHGICNDDIDPDCTSDGSTGAVKKSVIYQLYDWLVDPNEFPAQSIWIAGYAQYRKYKVLKVGSIATLLSSASEIDSTGIIRIDLTFTMPDPSLVYAEVSYGASWEAMNNPTLFEDEAITLYTKIPADWTAVRVTQVNGESHVYRVYAGEARYEAYVNRGEISLENADVSEVDIVYVGDSSGAVCTDGDIETETRTTQYEQELVPFGETCQLIEQTRTRTCVIDNWELWSDWSPPGYETCTEDTSSVIPASPTALEGYANPNNTVSLNWSAADFTSYYRVYRAIPTPPGYLLLGTTPTTEFIDSDPTLTAGETYTYAVQACNSAHECSSPSDYADVTLTPSSLVSYYVSETGDDTNPGTEIAPWATLQYAASTAPNGSRVIVGPGLYEENVVINRSGASEADRVVFISETLHAAKVQRFTVSGSYITLEGFEVEAEAAQVSGIAVNNGSYIHLLKNDVHDCPYFGIMVVNGDHVSLLDNHIHDVAQAGIALLGSNNLIEGNNIENIVEHHEKIGEVVLGDDADGIRLFGDQNVIRNNRIVNFADMSEDAHGTLVSAHADCIQTTHSSGTPVMSNTLIENNFCQSEHISSKGIMINSTSTDPLDNLVVRNNIFEIMDVGLSAYEDYYQDIYVYNNIFRCKLKVPYVDPWYSAGIMIGSSTRPVSNYLVANNITINCNNQAVYGTSGTGEMSDNLRWNSYGIPGYVAPGGTDPLFQSFSEAFNDSDYHLLSTSPAIDTGLTITDLLSDFDGTARPLGSGYDIGPYEFVQ